MQQLIRERYYRIFLASEFDGLADTLNAAGFTEENGAGFRLHSILGGKIIGSFVESKIRAEVFVDPYGKESTREIVSYPTIAFELSPLKLQGWDYLLRIENPPSSLKRFVNELQKIFGVQFSIAPRKIEVERICQKVSSSKKYFRFRITSIWAKEIPLGDLAAGVRMSVKIQSPGNAYSDYVNLLRPIAHQIEGIKIESKRDDPSSGRKYVEFRRAGGLLYTSDMADFVEELI